MSRKDIQQDEDDGVVEDEATFEDTLTLEPEDTDDYTQVEHELPPQEMCAAHTLNLVASTDLDKSLSVSSFSRNLYRSFFFAKCISLWNNKTSRSTVALDYAEGILKRKLTVLTSTRWNSYYDAVSRITENSLHEINALCTKLKLHYFTDKEFTFLTEHCKVLYPFIRGLYI